MDSFRDIVITNIGNCLFFMELRASLVPDEKEMEKATE